MTEQNVSTTQAMIGFLRLIQGPEYSTSKEWVDVISATGKRRNMNKAFLQSIVKDAKYDLIELTGEELELSYKNGEVSQDELSKKQVNELFGLCLEKLRSPRLKATPQNFVEFCNLFEVDAAFFELIKKPKLYDIYHEKLEDFANLKTPYLTEAVDELIFKGTFNVHLSPELISATLIVLLNILIVELAVVHFEEMSSARRKSVEELTLRIQTFRFVEDLFVEPYERHLTRKSAKKWRDETKIELENLLNKQVRLNREAIAVLRKSIFFTDTLGLGPTDVKEGRRRMDLKKTIIRDSLNFFTYYSGQKPKATEPTTNAKVIGTYSFLQAIFNELDLGEAFSEKGHSNASRIRDILASDDFIDEHMDNVETNQLHKGKDFPLLRIFQDSDRNTPLPKHG